MAFPEEPTHSAKLGELERLLNLLLGAAVLWSRRNDFDETAVDKIRERAILLVHEWYVERIPVYRQLAEERGAVAVGDVRTVADQCLFGTELFKSYDAHWLDEARYDRMTEWLRGVFVRRPRVELKGVRDVETWRNRLRGDQIYLMYSSGTSGRLSFVPRDVATWNALCQNPYYYSPTPTNGSHDARRSFDCLVLGPRGSGFGLQAAAIGLARAAARTHYLFDAELDADTFRSLGADAGRTREPVARRFVDATTVNRDGAYAAAVDFLREAIENQRRVVLFGPPLEVDAICSRILADGHGLRLASESSVITGGGWKLNEHRSIPREELTRRVVRALGVPGAQIVDAYSTAESNCVFKSCPEGRYHVPPLVEPVVLDDLFMTVPGDDVAGRLGFLDPFARSYPGFLATGDVGRLVRGRCACGLSGWALVGDIQRTPSEEPVGCAAVLASASA